MNKTLRDFANSELKKNLGQCTDEQQLLFKRMYSHNNLEKNINDVVDNLPDERISWAMEQVERTLKGIKGVR